MLELKNVSKEFVSPKKYPGFKGAIKGLFSNEKVSKVAVDDISFTIQDGEIVGYIGSNGAGKSTTIKMMTGILNPSKGTCLVDGINPSKKRKENAQNIGVVFGQRTQLWWDLPLIRQGQNGGRADRGSCSGQFHLPFPRFWHLECRTYRRMGSWFTPMRLIFSCPLCIRW